jgi:hypothetical protein
MFNFSQENWYHYLTDWQVQLVEVTDQLVEQYSFNQEELVDYSFLIFPMAKAYEGFLKKFFLDLRLIDRETYEGRRFRIGRALNPDVSINQRDRHWLYSSIEEVCSPETAAQLWKGWLQCRNKVFHFFPKDKGLLTYEQAVKKIEQLNLAMSTAVECYHRQR